MVYLVLINFANFPSIRVVPISTLRSVWGPVFPQTIKCVTHLLGHFQSEKWYISVVLIHISLITSDVYKPFGFSFCDLSVYISASFSIMWLVFYWFLVGLHMLERSAFVYDISFSVCHLSFDFVCGFMC